MQPGDVVDGRFAIEAVAGSGGMGTVFRARDRASGDLVAIKVLRAEAREARERFVREVRVLAGLRHPGIVRYIADGATGPSGRDLWLAMEWIQGETLGERLIRLALTPAESLEIARRVAEALGAAHAKGVIHRDIKPSNIMLSGGALESVKVVDFGVARITDATHMATRTGIMVGTPGYMAPEQARGNREVTAAADVFAVACVLFECLTGRHIFVGDNVMAVLAKILLEETPRLRDVRPDLPEALDRLLARALSKQPELRPRDGMLFALELSELRQSGRIDRGERPPEAEASAALTGTEQRLLCVVLIGGGDAGVTDATIRTDEATLASDEREQSPVVGPLRDVAAQHGGNLERLVDGSYVVTLAGGGGASDQAIRAARCALALKVIAPTAPMALATGRGVMAGGWPVGEAIDRAARLVAVGIDAVRIDEVTAGLLDSRFDVRGDGAGLTVVGERDVVEVGRTLLGKPTACVGRDRELAMLSGLYDECVGEPIARAVVVTGAAGVGKSRVRFELLRRIKERGEPVEVWFGRGDPLQAGSTFGMLGPALRRAAGILDGEPVEVRRKKLRARVMRHAGPEPRRTIQFLGELIGAPFEDDDVELRAARQDPLLMADQVRRAFEHLVALETAAQPLVIVLEDLHWGDLPSVRLIDAALRALPDRPWLVLALARPELAELFPRLWEERGAQHVRLDELTKKGAEKLVRGVLGPSATDSVVARLVEQAAGNAFYLEELVRAFVEGKGEAMPATVLAVVQGRLERLEADARRVLRAASVYGQRFWRGAVTALLGGVARDTPARAWLDELVERELIAKAPASRFPGEDELYFRHALIREAAYGMLTDADRQLGHSLAATWLERAGEGEPIMLAEHHERGGDPAAAIDHYRRASEQALAAGDFAAAAARAERGVACGAKGEMRGALRLAEAEAHKWIGEHAAALVEGREAMGLSPPGGARWFAAAGEAAEAAGKLGDVETLTAIGQALREASRRPACKLAARATPIAHAAFQLFNIGRYELAQALLDQVEFADEDVTEPGILARIHQVRSSRAMFAGDAGAYLVSELAAAREFERAGDERYACMQRGHVGYACLEIGAFADAERYLREALASGTRMGLSHVIATAKHNLGRALQRQGRLDEAEEIERAAVAAFEGQGDKRLEAASRFYLGEILVERGDVDTGEREIRRALELALPPSRPSCLAGLAQVLLARGRVAEALAAAREGHAQLELLGGVEEGESAVRLMLATCLDAAGDEQEALHAASSARERLRSRAAKITDPTWRTSFLENLPENARTVALAARLGV
jgi:eukaryotic-like serine/threonine-protein kinase